MKFLFDSSALMNIIQIRGSKAYDLLKNNFTIDLTYYEIGNIIWKFVYRKLISLQEGSELIENMEGVFNSLNVIQSKIDDIKPIFAIATKQNITFYDSAFIHYSKKEGKILITDDKKLIKVARAIVEVRESQDL
jgi:predicted nucleic acid-binding protein